MKKKGIDTSAPLAPHKYAPMLPVKDGTIKSHFISPSKPVKKLNLFSRDISSFLPFKMTLRAP
jgi:hypothetical protein